MMGWHTQGWHATVDLDVGRSIDHFSSSLDDPINPIVQNAQKNKGNDALDK